MYIPTTTLTQSGVVQTYVPVLTGSVSNPTLGAGAESYGYYSVVGQVCSFWMRVQVGVAGFVNGSGSVIFSLPLPMDTTFSNVVIATGGGFYYDNSGGDIYSGTPISGSGATNTMVVRINSLVSVVLNYTNPVTWAASDELSMAGSYVLA